ncbi:hypothetical protein FB45DRAFT_889849 [Roridomyces roridus]|uniref:Uncharacterized protein n=1 Tax=Roridomyces roridus TaxID=1738132 RepID=A0AAD7G385_9AGAR|nr:hypothetical protein FB45DRAFT_889849 [Roridomyces roridus]
MYHVWGGGMLGAERRRLFQVPNPHGLECGDGDDVSESELRVSRLFIYTYFLSIDAIDHALLSPSPTMATIVQRPTPTPSFDMPARSNSLIPQRRSRPSVEIIDVDQFEETETATRPAQRRRVNETPQVIEVLDSDDEDQPGHASSSRHQGTSSGAAASGSRQGQPSSSRRYRSPLPPPFDISVPPVPPLPRRYSGFGSMIPRARPPRLSPPRSSNAGPSRVPEPIRPINRPFIFSLTPPPPFVRGISPPPAEQRAAPAARHNPPMGFGGAIISSNHARLAAERLERQRRNERRAAGGRVAPLVAQDGPRNIFSRLSDYLPRFGGGGHLAHLDDEEDERTRADAQIALDIFLTEQNDVVGRRGFAQREVALLRTWRRGHKDDVDYKPEWTHPPHADGGFVFDFAPSELSMAPPAGGKGKGKEVVIDVDEVQEKEGVSTLLVCAKCLDPLVLRPDTMPEEEAKRVRVWGLRCGHLIDGKCLEELMKVEEEEEEMGIAEGSGKGKSKASEQEDDLDSLFEDQAPLEQDTSIRSRLRSRNHASTVVAFEIAVPLPPRPKKKLKARKSKSKPKKPVVEARSEWLCPVEGCARVHVSERIGGVWGDAPGQGAIGVFV